MDPTRLADHQNSCINPSAGGCGSWKQAMGKHGAGRALEMKLRSLGLGGWSIDPPQLLTPTTSLCVSYLILKWCQSVLLWWLSRLRAITSNSTSAVAEGEITSLVIETACRVERAAEYLVGSSRHSELGKATLDWFAACRMQHIGAGICLRVVHPFNGACF